MQDEEWIKILADGRRVKFTKQEALEDGAFITAQVEGNKGRLFGCIDQSKKRLSREEVESHFEGELSKK